MTAPSAAEAPPAPEAAPVVAPWRASLGAHVVPAALLTALAFVLVLGHVATFSQLSPIDEVAHYDYLRRLPDIPVTGDRMQQESLELWACRGVGIEEVQLPSCDGGPYHPDLFPGGSYNLAGTHPPLYYVATAMLARPVSAATGLDFLTSARAVGVLGLTALLLVTYALAITIGASRTSATGAATLLASSPALVTTASTLGPDVAAATAGGLVILTALRFRGTWLTAAPVLAVAFLAGLTKVTVFTAVAVAIFYLLLHRTVFLGGPRDWTNIRKDSALAVALGVAFAVPSLAWMLRASALATIDPATIQQNTWFQTDSLPLQTLPAHVLTFLTPLNDGWIAPYLEGMLQYRLESYVTGALLLGLVAAALYFRRRPDASAMASGVLALAIVGAPFLVLMNFFAYGMYYQIPARYGYALLAGYAAAAAFAFRARPLARALVGVAGVTAFLVILQAQPFDFNLI